MAVADNYTLQDWIDERRVALDWELMERAERFPAVTCTDPNYVPECQPMNLYSTPSVRDDRDWVRDAFVVKAEIRFIIR